MKSLLLIISSSISLLAFSQKMAPEDYFELFSRNTDDYEKATVYLDKAWEIAVQQQDSQSMSKALDYKGWLRNNNGDFSSAIKLYLQALEISERIDFTERKAIILNHLGSTYWDSGQLDSALYYYITSLKVRRVLGDQIKIANVLNNIGALYLDIDNTEKAEKFLSEAYTIYIDEGERFKAFETSANLAAVYHEQGRFDKLWSFATPIMADKESLNGNIDMSALYYNLGLARFVSNMYDSAMVLFEESVIAARQWNNGRTLSNGLTSLGNLYLTKNDLENAYKFLSEGREEALRSNSLFGLIKNSKAFWTYYKVTKEPEKALAFNEEFITLKDSLYSIQRISKMDNFHLSIMEEENQKIIQATRASLSNHSQTSAIVSALSGLFLLLLIGGWKRLTAIRKGKLSIENNVKELEKTNSLLNKDVSERTMQLREINATLDNFIYRTSHDIRGPLATLKGLSQAAQLEEMDDVAKDYFKKFHKMTDNLDVVLMRLQEVSGVKDKAAHFRIVNICHIIEECINANSLKPQFADINVIKEFKGNCELVTDYDLANIALQQIIDNAYTYFDFSANHSSFIKIETNPTKEGIKIAIIDNGIGIPEQSLERIFNLFERASDRISAGGIGLYLAKLAIDKIGGTVTVKSSQENRTTTFEVLIPSQSV